MRIIKKVIFKVLRVIKVCLVSTKVDISYSDAEQVLNTVCPDVKSSCFVGPRNSFKEVKFDLSVIIPTYNNENFVEECIESVLLQDTIYNFEIIVINDGSTDNTKYIIEKYRDNEKVTIIEQGNKGLSGARNSGIDAATGKYLMFVDSDDKLLPNAITALMDCAIRNDADCVEGGYMNLYRNGRTREQKVKQLGKVSALGGFRGFMWAKVYKMECFDNIRFPDKYWFEDSINAQILFEICKKCYTIADFVYLYRENINSITHLSLKKPKAIDSLWITQQLLKDREIAGFNFGQNQYEYFLRMVELTYQRTINLDEKTKKCIFVIQKKLREKYYNEYKTTYTNYRSKIEMSLKNNDYKMYLMALELRV